MEGNINSILLHLLIFSNSSFGNIELEFIGWRSFESSPTIFTNSSQFVIYNSDNCGRFCQAEIENKVFNFSLSHIVISFRLWKLRKYWKATVGVSGVSSLTISCISHPFLPSIVTLCFCLLISYMFSNTINSSIPITITVNSMSSL